MKEFSNIRDILDFAIQNEQEAIDLYKKLSANASNKEMKQIFEEFAQEEVAHKARLLKFKETGISELPNSMVSDLKIADYCISKTITSESTYEEALIYAMRNEKAAFRLYSALAEKAQDNQTKDLFISLAMEEAKHKLRFELEYDEQVMKDN